MGLVDRLRRLGPWFQRNKKNVFLSATTIVTACSIAYSFKLVPGGHVVVIQDVFGNVRNCLYAENQLVLKIPFFQKGISMRTLPTKKRFVKECAFRQLVVFVLLVGVVWCLLVLGNCDYVFSQGKQ